MPKKPTNNDHWVVLDARGDRHGARGEEAGEGVRAHRGHLLLEDRRTLVAQRLTEAAADDESNFKLADEGLFQPLQIPLGQVHRLLTERSEAEAVQMATDELQQFAVGQALGQPVVDLVFLGMGEDAHVASLFPGDTEAIDSQAVYRAVTGPKPPPRRITLGYPALAAAREVWVLASGEGKAGALRDSLTVGSDTPLGRVLYSREQTEIFTDFEV